MSSLHHPHWPKGVPFELRVPQVTLIHYLQTAALRYPSKPAIIFCHEVMTYEELQRQVDCVASYLQQVLKVAHGDRVLLVSQNCPQFIVAFYACLRIGAAVVPVSPMSTLPEIEYYVGNSGAKVAFVAQDILPRVEPLLSGVGEPALEAIIVHTYSDNLPSHSIDFLPEALRFASEFVASAGLHSLKEILATKQTLQPVTLEPSDLAVLPYTSGTTGQPKGCHHTHSTVLASNLASQVWRGLHCDTVALCVAPMFHMLGMQSGMNVPITLGATIVMMPRWDAALAVELVERYRVTAWAAPPSMVIDFYAQPSAKVRDLSSLTVLSGGGATMPEAVAKMLSEKFGIFYNEAYGLSETASFLHANPPARGKRQCLGIPAQAVDSRIIDPTTLQELPRGEVGELVTHAAQVMKGYWRNEQADKEAFIDIDGKRFLRTGDLAMIDEEGYFFMRDRLKRMINASGYKVWPAEVEAMMYDHPAVHEACIIGVLDEKRGENVLALVVLKPAARGTLNEQALIDWCRERMAVYKAPRILRFVESLPKSSTGKIMWRELQEQERREFP
jgi:fatty-acyl-CoA synthase